MRIAGVVARNDFGAMSFVKWCLAANEGGW
jgi:hypothetical protein